jgi:HEAT repeat protein
MPTHPDQGGWLAFLLLLLSGLVVALILAAVLLRTARTLRDRRRERLAAAPRRALLAFLAEGGEEGADDLLAIQADGWRAVEPAAVAMLGKVRGEVHQALADVFEQRGVGVRAQENLRHLDPVHRARAAETLGYLGRTDAVEPVGVLLDDRNADVRVVAARALGAIGSPAAVEPMLAALTRHGLPAHLVAYALSRIGADAVPALQTALGQDEPAVRATALRALGLIGAIGSVPAITDVLRQEPDQEVRLAAVTTLGKLGGRSAVEPLLAALAPDQPAALRAAAAQSLGDVGAPSAGEALSTMLADPDYHVAHASAQALRRLGPTGLRHLHRIAAHEPGPAPAPAGAGCTVLLPGTPPARASTAPAAHARQALALHGLSAGPDAGPDLVPSVPPAGQRP